ncbi:MAG: beta-N-acetylhexosaminidase [Pseudomonadota bacterium]
MRISAAIFGCSGLELNEQEREFFQKTQPFGFILFGRNIDTPAQVTALVSQLKSCVSHDDVPVLIDQEGGRVRRLRPPHWPEYHSGSLIGQRYKQDKAVGQRLAWLQSRLMAFDLARLGINVDCLPVLDVPVPGSHDVIGDRAYGTDAETITCLGRAACVGMLDGGVLPVIKHIPGHGRAGSDSHMELPRVGTPLDELKATDFVPFQQLSAMPMAMTAHVVYEAIDPDFPATTSKTIIDEIIRGVIGFDGLLMCDDIAMHALSGNFSSRTRLAIEAGCDVVLHCNGNIAQMEEVAGVLPDLKGQALKRAQNAFERISGNTKPVDEMQLRDEFAELIGDKSYEADPTEVIA